ncbi:MAG: isochorismate synthase MenF [Anaerolineae bacterium]
MTHTDHYESIPEHYGRLVSLSAPCPDVTLLGFLRYAQGNARFYWEKAGARVAFAGFGTALELMAWGENRFAHIQQQAHDLFAESVVLDESAPPETTPRLFGGFAFRDDFVPDNTWSVFTPAQFILPHYQLTQFEGETWLTINAHVPFEENPRDLLPELRAALMARIHSLQAAQQEPMNAVPLHPTEVNYPMPYATWARNITAATSRMKAGELNKAVLSRVCEIRFEERVDVDSALMYLADAYAECYRFLFEPRPYHAFYGATPELLAGVEGTQVQTMGLAGSIRRGKTAEEDHANAQQLLHDPKERYEHQLVVDRVQERLLPLTRELQVSDTGIYRLSNIQHLYTPITGTLQQAEGVLPVVAALHPTPALGGDPRDVAMQVIGDYEPVPRGWYAAPVGWLDRDLNGEFGVAIRSAVSQEKRVWLYAGAGIVAESDPQKEWDETALKFRPMLDALGVREKVNIHV